MRVRVRVSVRVRVRVRVQKKFLEEPEMEDLKLRFYGLMVRSFVQFFMGN